MALDGPRRKPKSGGSAKSLVIFCHGYGSNGDDLIALAEHFAPLLPDTEFVSPNAPDPVAILPGGYQWFDIAKMDPDILAKGVRKAAPVLDEFIDQEMERTGLPANKIALVGFSQGTILSLHVGLRRKKKLAGILGYSGALAAPETLKAEMASKPRIQLIHGDADEVLPVAFTFGAVEALRDAGHGAAWHISHMVGHSIDQQGLVRGGRFLHEVLT